MRKRYTNLPVKVIRGNTLEQLKLPMKPEYPFDEKTLGLLKEENLF